MPASSPEPSFSERAHRAITDAHTPGAALDSILPILERELAPAGTLLYRLDPGGTMSGVGGTLDDVFAEEPWFFADDPCQDPSHHDRGPDILYATRAVERRAHEHSNAYREFYGPRGIAHVACVRLGPSADRTSAKLGLFLGRSDASGDFSGADEHTLKTALPLLAALCRASGAWTRTEQWLAGSDQECREDRAEFDAPAGAIMVFSLAGRCMWCSSAAKQLLGALLASADRDRLMGRLTDQIAVIAARSESGLPFAVDSVIPAGPQYGVDVRIERHQSFMSPYGEASFLVRLDPRHNLDSAALAIARFDLTPTELKVLDCLAEGMSNHEIAQCLEIKSSTAATHVKRILSKLQVSSRLKAGLLMQRIRLIGGSS